MICAFCHCEASLAGAERIDPCDPGSGIACGPCVTNRRAVSCVVCERMHEASLCVERPDLGEAPTGGSYLCAACQDAEESGDVVFSEESSHV